MSLAALMAKAEVDALKALARYDYQAFARHANKWTDMACLADSNPQAMPTGPSPFGPLAKMARARLDIIKRKGE